MENVDLNIENYELEDLLKLFNLNYNFNKQDLKEAKKIVLKVHPDKSNLDKEYFIFFSKAFKIIYYIFEFRNQKNTTKSTLYNIEKNEENEILLKEFRNSKNFNKIFNELFEKNYLKDNDTNEGYGDWLKSTNEEENKISNISDMHREIENKKTKISALANIEINDYEESDYKDITGVRPECYSSSIFSTLNYEDVKKAHTETLIPVSENEILNRRNFNNINDIKNFRNEQDIKPLSEKQALEYLNNKEEKENKLSTLRAFNLVKQDERYKKMNENWMSGFKQIKDT